MTGPILLIARLLSAFVIPTEVWADDFKFTCTVDRDSVTVGDRIFLKLELHRPLDDTSVVAPELSLPSALQVMDSPRATSTREDGRQLIAQTIELTAFQTGSFTIPPGDRTAHTVAGGYTSAVCRSDRCGRGQCEAR